jgi:hypothetical protein
MSRTSPVPSLLSPSLPARDRLKHLLSRAVVSSSALAVGVILPIKWPDALGE